MNTVPFHLKFFLLLISILWITSSNIFAQCGETILISCGTSLTGEYCYGNNEDCEITFCPEISGGVITFSIDTGVVEAFSDQFHIYYGSTTGDPNISLSGTLTGNSITSPVPDDCLTIQIISDAFFSCATGEINENIDYTVSCEMTCPFIADFMMSNDEICPMEVISLEAVDTSETITYTWDFGDGNTATGASVEHTFSTSGGKIVALTATLDGCTQTTKQFVKVAPIPEILTEVQGELIGDELLSACPKDSILITANVLAGTIWTPMPLSQIDTSIVIDSLNWGMISSSVVIEIDNTLSIIEEITEIEFCIEMIHDWFTDAEIIVQSPDETEVMLLEYEDWTLGRIYLNGIYCFSMNAEKIMLESLDSLLDDTLPPGNYLPAENFDALIGSPINGTWTFTFNDYFPSVDDGVVYNISFSATNIEPLADTIMVDIADVAINGPTEMTWTIIDSTYQYIGEMPEESGLYTYTITITDDFECIYEENIDIEVLPYSNEICPRECPLVAIDTITFEVCQGELIELPTGDFIKVDSILILPDISIGLMDNGCDSLVTFEIIVITHDSCHYTSLNNIEHNEVTIYPNPAKEKTALTIHLLDNAIVSISIYDLIGKRIQTIIEEQKVGTGFQQFLIETHVYTQGIYFAHLTINDEQIVKKIIVE